MAARAKSYYKEFDMSDNKGKHPQGYWMGIGIATGIALGVALGAALENTGSGIAIGIAIGAGIGASLEQGNKKNTRPLTEVEQKRQKWGLVVGLVVLLAIAGILITLLFLRAK
jgi:hypothetical protein